MSVTLKDIEEIYIDADEKLIYFFSREIGEDCEMQTVSELKTMKEMKRLAWSVAKQHGVGEIFLVGRRYKPNTSWNPECGNYTLTYAEVMERNV